jgi:cell division transport system permease protein
MLWTNTKRVIKAGFINFWRNGFVSLASLLVMSVMLLIIGSIIFTSAILDTSLQQIKSKVDINVYFVTTAREADILLIRDAVRTLPEVDRIEYISRDQALADFRNRHQNDQLTLQALDELKENPINIC